MNRRHFLSTTLAAGAGLSIARRLGAAPSRALRSTGASQGPLAATSLQLHPFINAHPDAVFIRRTNVADKLDSNAKFTVGSEFASELFSASDTGDIPFTNAMAIKPNLTCTSGTGNSPAGMGIMTDIPFVDGVLQGLRDRGFPGYNLFMREGNWLGDGYCASEYPVTGPMLEQLVQRHGCHVYDFPTGRRLTDMTLETLQSGTEVIWRDVPDGVVFKRIGYVAPYNDDNTFLLNIAKFKTHGMGMTLTVKNLQGMAVSPYVRFCEGLDSTAQHPSSVLINYHTDREQRIDAFYAAHLAKGYPRWDCPGRTAEGGYGMETWAQRTCDSHSITRVGLNIIEGIYGRNGDGFNAGPGPGDTPQDFMSNILIFGKNAFLVDIIGAWLAGHEPGNFGLFHIARERGLCPTLVPDHIPLYDWNAGEPAPIILSEQQRTPLLTPYLRRDYNGQTEAKYHLVNEPFDYSTVSVGNVEARPSQPEITALQNPVRETAVFELRFPVETRARVEVFNSVGQRVYVLRDASFAAGAHSIRWRPGHLAPGMYVARLSASGSTVSARVMLLR
ncbi:MAG: DUF362 domain-containing protein [Bacteroidota bacterium]